MIWCRNHFFLFVGFLRLIFLTFLLFRHFFLYIKNDTSFDVLLLFPPFFWLIDSEVLGWVCWRHYWVKTFYPLVIYWVFFWWPWVPSFAIRASNHPKSSYWKDIPILFLQFCTPIRWVNPTDDFVHPKVSGFGFFCIWIVFGSL